MSFNNPSEPKRTKAPTARVGAIRPETEARSWLEFEHIAYAERLWKWRFARDMYTGDVLDDGKIKDYLIRKATGETVESYTERYKLADYTNHMGTVLDALAGMLYAVEEDAMRTFKADADEKAPLGDPKDPTSPIGRMWIDADGEGRGWLTVFKQFTIELLLNHMGWLMLDADEDGNPMVKIVPAESVPNWLFEGPVIKEALVKEWVDTRTSLVQDPDEFTQVQYVHFTVEGWQRWTVDDDGDPIMLPDSGTYSYVTRTGEPTLPIFPIELPMRRHVGYSIARKANAIFNKESERDHLLRVANFPKLNVVGVQEVFRKVEQALKKGAIALWNDPKSATQHGWIAPDTSGASIATEVLKRKVEEFYVTAFREYGDSARERVTATEVRQDASSGVGAFLEMLKAGVDDAEQGILWRLEQQQFSTDPSKWWKATVTRSSNFLPVDVGAMIDKLKSRYFGETATIPIGREGMKSVVRQVAEWDNLKVEESEIENAVTIYVITRTLDSMASLPIPAEAKAQMAVDMLVATGQVDPKAKVAIEGQDDPVAMTEFLKEQALMIALARQEAAQRAAEMPSPFGG